MKQTVKELALAYPSRDGCRKPGRRPRRRPGPLGLYPHTFGLGVCAPLTPLILLEPTILKTRLTRVIKASAPLSLNHHKLSRILIFDSHLPHTNVSFTFLFSLTVLRFQLLILRLLGCQADSAWASTPAAASDTKDCMDILSFQSENPAEIDAFKGASHDRVATAINNYLRDPKNHKVIGLDGEFGSGKSSILQMLEKKITAQDPATRLWLFDCEQNYQGSIKSNFIELFTDQVLAAIPAREKPSVRDRVLKSRDIALGRHVSYTKDTRSHISLWAILLIAGGVLSPTLLRDYLGQLHQPLPLDTWKHWAYALGILFPGLVLGAAMIANRWKGNKGKKRWNLSSILKGSSDDHITETIEISKEVSPLDLKRTLAQHLAAVSGTHFIIVIDNLDRLPRETLRSVWSDLEIFTSVSTSTNLSIIVPFCSTKVSKYLNGDEEKSYDSKDFIAKKFPVVFRAPPVITSGWKDAFRSLWVQSFGSVSLDQADACSLILKRHSPMANGLVTPRLQKRFINDLATTVLVTAGEPKLEVIAAYIAVCKYNAVPIETLLRTGTENLAADEQAQSKENDPVSAESLRKTRQLLTSLYGLDVDHGWPIQVLQVHFQTSKDIAVAELIDQPLATAIEAQDGKKFVELTHFFGFMDSFNRYLEGDVSVKEFLLTLHQALLVEGFDAAPYLAKASIRLSGDARLNTIQGDDAYYSAIKALTKAGLNKALFRGKLQALASEFDALHGFTYAPEEADGMTATISTYDAYLDALEAPFEPRTLSNSEILFHLILSREDLKVIDVAELALDDDGIGDAIRQVSSTAAIPYDLTPLDDNAWESCFVEYFGRLKLEGRDRSFQFDETQVLQIITHLPTNITDDRYWVALAFYRKYVIQIGATVAAHIGAIKSTRSKLAIATIFLRQGMFTELAGIPGIEDALSNSPDFFNALVRSNVTSGELIEACLKSEVVNLMAPVMVRQLRAGKIAWPYSRPVYNHYEALTRILDTFGYSEGDFLKWFAGRTLATANLPEFKDIDPLILTRILDGDYPSLVKMREFVFDERFAKLDAAGWSNVITEDLAQRTQALVRMIELDWPFSTTNHAYDAMLAYLSGVAKQAPFTVPPSHQIDALRRVLKLLPENDRAVLGTQLRSIFYEPECTPAAGLFLLGYFGSLIPTFTPINEVEGGRLLQVFNLIGTQAPCSEEAAQFLDSRHQQLTLWAPGDLVDAYMTVVTTRKEDLPNLYAGLANKKGIKRKMKQIAAALFS